MTRRTGYGLAVLGAAVIVGTGFAAYLWSGSARDLRDASTVSGPRVAYEAGPYRIGLQLEPATPRVGDNEVTLRLQGREGQSVRGASVRAVAEMPAMGARVIGTVDAFDAMSSTRTYRGAMERDRVLGELRKNAGAQFDPALVEAFLTIDLGAYDDAVSRHHAMSLEGGLRVGRRSNAA